MLVPSASYFFLLPVAGPLPVATANYWGSAVLHIYLPSPPHSHSHFDTSFPPTIWDFSSLFLLYDTWIWVQAHSAVRLFQNSLFPVDATTSWVRVSHTHPTATARLCVSPHLQAPDPLRTTCLSAVTYIRPYSVCPVSLYLLEALTPFPGRFFWAITRIPFFILAHRCSSLPRRLESQPACRNTINHYMYYSLNIFCHTTLLHIRIVTCLAVERFSTHAAITCANTNSSTSASM